MRSTFNIGKSQNWFAGEDTVLAIDVTVGGTTTPQAMAGWALEWRWKTSRLGREVLVYTTADQITIGDGNGSDDRATIQVLAADTEGVAQTRGYHELWRTDFGYREMLTRGYAWLQNGGAL